MLVGIGGVLRRIAMLGPATAAVAVTGADGMGGHARITRLIVFGHDIAWYGFCIPPKCVPQFLA